MSTQSFVNLHRPCCSSDSNGQKSLAIAKATERFLASECPRVISSGLNAKRIPDRYFTNLAVELALFRLDAEDERFDWRWIDQRRDSSLPSDEALRAAPESWRMWVKEGTTAIERCRRWRLIIA